MPHRCIRRSLFVVALSLALSAAARASPDPAAQGEIDHLLRYVAQSSCTFVRNGDEYSGEKAREHLAMKYRFVGGRISTAEEFIQYLGTGSSVSGEPYHVKCGNVDALSGPWLTAELQRYRQTVHVRKVAQ